MSPDNGRHVLVQTHLSRNPERAERADPVRTGPCGLQTVWNQPETLANLVDPSVARRDAAEAQRQADDVGFPGVRCGSGVMAT